MSGLEKIEQEILKEAVQKADALTQEAAIQAEELLCRAREKAQRQAEDIIEKAKEESVSRLERDGTAEAVLHRKALLLAKQEAVIRVLEQAQERLLHMEEKEYLKTVRKKLEERMRAEDGEILFSKADMECRKEALEREVQQLSREKGTVLRFGKADPRIDRGFLLVYGGIEENCTFSAMFRERRAEFADGVCEILFGSGKE